jgi:hypothetical protein
MSSGTSFLRLDLAGETVLDLIAFFYTTRGTGQAAANFFDKKTIPNHTNHTSIKMSATRLTTLTTASLPIVPATVVIKKEIPVNKATTASPRGILALR